MTLTAMIILAVAVAVAALWRLVRLVIRLALVVAIVAAGGWYLHRHPPSTKSPSGSPATRQVERSIDREVHNLTGGHPDRVIRGLTSTRGPQNR
jgi:apolipoprotein N-acyltransferase